MEKGTRQQEAYWQLGTKAARMTASEKVRPLPENGASAIHMSRVTGVVVMHPKIRVVSVLQKTRASHRQG
jgi:hypothetical protein